MKYQFSQSDRLMKHHIKPNIAKCFRQKSTTLQKPHMQHPTKLKKTKQKLFLALRSHLWRSPSKPSGEVTQVSQPQSVGIQLLVPFKYLYDNFAAKVWDIFLSEVDAMVVHTVFRESYCKYPTFISILLTRHTHLYELTP